MRCSLGYPNSWVKHHTEDKETVNYLLKEMLYAQYRYCVEPTSEFEATAIIVNIDAISFC